MDMSTAGFMAISPRNGEHGATREKKQGETEESLEEADR